jgi:protein-tyrosine-phosphatase
MAAALLAQALAASDRQLTITSAGLHAKPYGGADERGRSAAVEFGCSLERHESQMVSKEMIDCADVVFVMDRLNEAKLLGRFPHAKDKVRLLGAYDAEATRLDITDPYEGELEDVRRCYERLARCVRRLATVLEGPATAESAGGETSPTPTGVAHEAAEQAWPAHPRPESAGPLAVAFATRWRSRRRQVTGRDGQTS